MLDLWPESVEGDTEVKAPAGIAREQASLLGKKTNNYVTAEVVQTSEAYWGGPRHEFFYNFNIVGPLLDDYRFRLFSFSHAITFYPVRFSVDSDILSEVNLDKKPVLEADSEEEFVDILKAIFHASKTIQVIDAIKAQSGSEPESELPF